MPLETVHDQLLKGELSKYYRPEFLNRFDGVVLFRPLQKEQIKHIAKLMLNVVAKDLEKRGVELRVEDSALEALAVIGFDPVFGARPMRRAIQDRVENALAQFILEGKLGRRDVVVLDGEGLRVEKAK
jgi:ATP-dependent Clp protease ATP-binding subunit ClpB